MNLKKFVIIVAGGSGTRMSSAIPKQFLLLGGIPILMRTLQNFSGMGIDIILVLPENQITSWENLCNCFQFNIPHRIVTGGETRFHSVKNGLQLVESNSLVAVHDGVRPFADKVLINKAFETAEAIGSAVPVVNLHDSVRIMEGTDSKATDRNKYRLVQTPQCFNSDILKKAYEHEFNPAFTDDAGLVESAGIKICLIEGSRYNLKITDQSDLKLAESIVNAGLA